MSWGYESQHESSQRSPHWLDEELSGRDFAALVHMHLTKLPSDLDLKASIVAGLSGSGLLFVADRIKNLLAGLYLQTGTASSEYIVPFQAMALAMSAIAALFLVLGLIFATFVIIPRVSSISDNLAFFRGIASFEGPEGYSDAVLGQDEHSLTRQLLNDCYYISHIVSMKAGWANWSIRSFIAGFFILLITIAVWGM